jgi:hypothetical protein
MVKIKVPAGIQQGKAVQPAKPMVYFELPAGSVVDLPMEVENFPVGDGMAEPAGSKGKNKTGGR